MVSNATAVWRGNAPTTLALLPGGPGQPPGLDVASTGLSHRIEPLSDRRGSPTTGTGKPPRLPVLTRCKSRIKPWPHVRNTLRFGKCIHPSTAKRAITRWTGEI